MTPTLSPALSPEYLSRFGGIARLYGKEALQALSHAHFAVIGLGGVGTWAAEAMARSGVGELTLIELDDVCITNTNRQIHTLQSTIGQPKNQVMSERLLAINPELKLHTHHDFLTKTHVESYIGNQHHVVVDAMDSVHVKAALAAYCTRNKIRLITCGSSGGKLDPSRITCGDLGSTKSDPLLSKMRNLLYHSHNFTKTNNRRFRIDAIYSEEQMVYPKPDGSVCSRKQFLDDGVKLDCSAGVGSSVMVTGGFGFAAAKRAIDRHLKKSAE